MLKELYVRPLTDLELAFGNYPSIIAFPEIFQNHDLSMAPIKHRLRSVIFQDVIIDCNSADSNSQTLIVGAMNATPV